MDTSKNMSPFFLVKQTLPQTLPCFRAKLGESLTLSSDSELSPDAGDSPLNARLWQWPMLLEFGELVTPWLNVVKLFKWFVVHALNQLMVVRCG